MRAFRLILALSVSATVLYGCRSNLPKAEPPSEASSPLDVQPHPEDETAPGDDSMPDTTTRPSEGTPGLPPGAVRLRAGVGTCDEETTRFACTLTVRDIAGYGMGAALTTPGDQLRMYFPKATFGHDLAEALQPDAEVDVAVTRNDYPGQTDQPPSWTAIGLY